MSKIHQIRKRGDSYGKTSPADPDDSRCRVSGKNWAGGSRTGSVRFTQI